MLQRPESLSSSGGYYFRSDFEHILQGLCIEHTPRGVYASGFFFPLYDFAGINLTFSERLGQNRGFIANESMTEESMVDFVMSSPEGRSMFARDKAISLPEFLGTIESLPYDWRSTRIAPIYIATMLMLGHDVRTSRLFQTFPGSSVLGVTDSSGWERLRARLQQGLEPAKNLLEEVRRQNMQALGLAE